MNRSESKYFNTAKLMDNALIELLETRSLEYISVKEICLKAGVNRSTFYLHYETVADLLNETMECINQEFMASFDTTTKDFFDKIKESSLSELVLINDYFLDPYLNFIYKNQNIFRASFNNPKNMGADEIYQAMILNILKLIMERFQIPEEVQSYWIYYYISGITAIIREWLNRNCKESIEQIKTIIIDCVRPDNGLLNKKFGE